MSGPAKTAAQQADVTFVRRIRSPVSEKTRAARRLRTRSAHRSKRAVIAPDDTTARPTVKVDATGPEQAGGIRIHDPVEPIYLMASAQLKAFGEARDALDGAPRDGPEVLGEAASNDRLRFISTVYGRNEAVTSPQRSASTSRALSPAEQEKSRFERVMRLNTRARPRTVVNHAADRVVDDVPHRGGPLGDAVEDRKGVVR